MVEGGHVDQGVEVRVGKQGRIVLPKQIRDQLGAEEGSVYTARVEDGRLILDSPLAWLRSVQQEIRATCSDGEVSVVDELIAQRRADAVSEFEA